MRTANELLRRHLRYSCRLLAPGVLPPPSPSLSNFSSIIPFHRRNFGANAHHASSYSPLFSNYMGQRAFSWFTWRNSMEIDEIEEDSGGSSVGRLELNSNEVFETAPEPPSVSSTASSQISENVFGENTWYDYPIQAVVSMLDGFHDFTGFPWWVTISVSTLALRASLLPVLILQLKKMAKFGALSAASISTSPVRKEFSRTISVISYEKKGTWLSLIFVELCILYSPVPMLFAMDEQHSEDGGTLWFLNLTDYPSGIPCFTFPTLIAGLHYINVQISFQTIKIANLQGVLGLLAKFYKLYLDILSIPLFLVGFYIPQGSLVYWVTNSSLTLIQQLCLKNPNVRNQLGLPNLMEPVKNRVATENEHNSAAYSEVLIPIEAVPPKKLLELALKDMAAGDPDKALILLRTTIEKDPELVQALVAIGQILCSKKLFEEAAENFELAIHKLSYIKEEEIGLLLLSLFGAGVSRIWQGKNSDGIEHLKKIAELREPDSPMDKACYYRGLVMLGSTLFQLGEKSEAAKYLRIAATYDPGVNAYLKECEEG
ncbi:hypothetical protein IEQ34_004002 [Dendrobium chrysotoxum]|uniref:ALBINO3-like protein 2, chloroplastic n=1 Tax=Dendrobium chrysotoxum TaxID=161865 RepID=A0AAV7HF64_DENCH|nr:hypothetical protein IEQ34_004002 [Dendrobium chrysotoxum]